jgi:hypothetical protein
MVPALTLVGVLVILVGLRDIFHTLLRPTGQGHLSSLTLTGVWKLSKATGHRLGSVVGPAAMVAVTLMWVALQTLGWALIYVPHIPDGFYYAPGVDPADYPDVLEAIYLSSVTLTTLGYGDMVPTEPGIRAASPLQSLTGFALLTAALSWFTQVPAPLLRRRALASELNGLANNRWEENLDDMAPAVVTRVVDGLAADVLKVRIDFAHHSEGYYFRESNPDLSLARQLPYVAKLRDGALTASDVAVRKSADRLSLALAQLCAELDDNFLHTGGGIAETLTAYASEHGQLPPS